MLFELLLFLALFAVYGTDDINKGKERPYIVLPLPLDVPNRNDLAEQCYLRIEDIEIIETISTYCDVAHMFLRYHLSEYNEKKQAEDDAAPTTPVSVYDNYKIRRHWKQTTILDPITKLRIYVTKKADCRLILYNRDGTSNYRVDCEKILSYVNDSSNGALAFGTTSILQIIVFSLFSILWNWL